jgi:3-methyladenine DNA glycosylase/8-oxoguanine DNA glycosylase
LGNQGGRSDERCERDDEPGSHDASAMLEARSCQEDADTPHGPCVFVTLEAGMGAEHGDPAPDSAAAIPLDRPLDLPLDLPRTVSLHRRGSGDPTMRVDASGTVWRATRTVDGPATVRLTVQADVLRVAAWGPGAAAAVAAAPAFAGLGDDPSVLEPRHPLVADLARRFRGVRVGRSGAVVEALVPAILEQKITGDEARRTFRNLVRVHGEHAPGPANLRLLPAPDVLAALPYYAYHPLGLERRRAELLQRVGREAARLEGTVTRALAGDLAEAYAGLRSLPGVGPWTAAEVGQRAYGDPDAVSVGDFHVPNMVCWALAREPRGTDERMLELLEPYMGQRGRVIRLLELAGVRAPRYGPRLGSRRIERL